MRCECVVHLTGVLMVLAASCEFDKRLNSEIVERPSDNEEIPEVGLIVMLWLVYELCASSGT